MNLDLGFSSLPKQVAAASLTLASYVEELPGVCSIQGAFLVPGFLLSFGGSFLTTLLHVREGRLVRLLVSDDGEEGEGLETPLLVLVGGCILLHG